MQIKKPVCAAGIAISLALTCTSALCAEEHDAADSDAFLSAAVPKDVLDGERGKANPPGAVLTVMGLDGSVQDNFAQNTVSGKNTITNGAFSNAAGLATAIMNSGNNVLIQNATILLLDVH